MQEVRGIIVECALTGGLGDGANASALIARSAKVKILNMLVQVTVLRRKLGSILMHTLCDCAERRVRLGRANSGEVQTIETRNRNSRG
jgi:hypothetical protein